MLDNRIQSLVVELLSVGCVTGRKEVGRRLMRSLRVLMVFSGVVACCGIGVVVVSCFLCG
jgi:hypothetical protein